MKMNVKVQEIYDVIQQNTTTKVNENGVVVEEVKVQNPEVEEAKVKAAPALPKIKFQDSKSK